MRQATFIDRGMELQALEELYEAPQADLFVLYGRRRVGKTALLRKFCQGKPHVYFQASQEPERDNVRHFLREAGDALADDLLAQSDYGDWETTLRYLARAAGSDRLIVILDEFPYLCDANPALPSILQRFWDHTGLQTRLMLILCGSSVSFMEQQVLAERSPLFGRRTGQLELLPLGYREAAAFLPGYSADQLAQTYGILGGMPMYYAQFDGRLSVAQNVQHAVLRPQAPLYNEPEIVLRMELRDLTSYNSILEAIADGKTKHSEIATRVDRPANAMSPYLAILENLRLVERAAPLTDQASGRRSHGRYFVCDPFVRFWYRFVLPNRSLVELGEGERVWAQRVTPQLDQFLGPAFESLCRQYVRRYGREKLGVLPDGEVGRFWSGEAEIDVLCRNADGGHVAGECKWSTRMMDERDLVDLQRKCGSLPAHWREDMQYVLFSRRGFTQALSRRAAKEGHQLISLEDLYRGVVS